MNPKTNAFDIGSLGRMDATEIAQQIQQKKLHPKEVLKDTFARIEALEPELNAITAERYKEAFAEADHLKEGIFSGVPLFIKDLSNVKGLPTLHGTRAMPIKPAKKNDKQIDQILSTGCLILGKSTTSEFGFLPSTETLAHGITRNPWHHDFSTGGSSGGSAALVAAGVVPISHTMDGGGSTRIPATCCNLIGLKPSRGRHADSPTKQLPVDIVTHGIVSRSVRDTANYFAAIEKHYPHPKLAPIGLVSHPGKKRLRIGMFTESPSKIDSNKEVKKVVHQTAAMLENMGHQVEAISCPFEQQFRIDFICYYAFLAYLQKNFGKVNMDRSFKKSKLEPFSHQLADFYPKVALSTPKILSRLKKFRKTYDAVFKNYDLLLSPVLSEPVAPIGYFSPEHDLFSMVEKLGRYTNFTIVQNASGAPAISLPMGVCDNGLPVGVQFGAAMGDERTLLEIAFELEESGAFYQGV